MRKLPKSCQRRIAKAENGFWKSYDDAPAASFNFPQQMVESSQIDLTQSFLWRLAWD